MKSRTASRDLIRRSLQGEGLICIDSLVEGASFGLEYTDPKPLIEPFHYRSHLLPEVPAPHQGIPRPWFLEPVLDRHQPADL